MPQVPVTRESIASLSPDALLFAIGARFSRGRDANHIDYIRFPEFRNLEANTKIDFDFPITVFVGPNGCGKSTTMQALYGAPEGRNLADYWFSTVRDTIGESERPAFIYSYSYSSEGGEVLKRRIFKDAARVENWDTSEPLLAYSMVPGAQRVPPIRKSVVYLNFRAIQNAYDKKFHENWPPEIGVQEFIRKRSHPLKKALGASKKTKIGRFKSKTNDVFQKFDSDELAWLSFILGRDYSEAILVRHRFFGHWAHSAKFTVKDKSYSEAWAGSGETAIALLVSEVFKLRAKPKGLLLLDEPETSLHPGAQKRLQLFLLKECIDYHHQIILCTHSPILVAGFPSTAIKVFRPTEAGNFNVLPNCTPEEAFFFIEQPNPEKKTIFVEDKLAAHVLTSTLKSMGAACPSLFQIIYLPGGVKTIFKDMVVHSVQTDAKRRFFVLDGDEFKGLPYDAGEITELDKADLSSLTTKLTNLILEVTGISNLPFHVDSLGSGVNLAQKLEAQINYLKYLRSNLRFIPARTPEELVWSDVLAKKIVDAMGFDEAFVLNVMNRLEREESFKEKFAYIAKVTTLEARANQIDSVHQLFTKSWINQKNTKYHELVAMLEELKMR